MYTKQNKKELIMSAAQKHFARYGLGKTTMDEIAKDAHVGKGTIYHYFKSKEHVFYTIIQKEVRILKSKILQAVKQAETPQEKLKAFILTRLKEILELVNFHRLTREAVDILQPQIEKALEKYRQEEIKIVEGIIKEGIKKKVFENLNTKLSAFAFMSVFRNLEFPWLIGKKVYDVEERVDFMLKIYLRGMEV